MIRIVTVAVLVVAVASGAYLYLSNRPAVVLEGVGPATGEAWTLAWHSDDASEDAVCLRLRAPGPSSAFEWCDVPRSPVSAALTTLPMVGPMVVGFVHTSALTSSLDGEILYSEPLADLGGARAFVQLLQVDDTPEVWLNAGGRELRVER